MYIAVKRKKTQGVTSGKISNHSKKEKEKSSVGGVGDFRGSGCNKE